MAIGVLPVAGVLLGRDHHHHHHQAAEEGGEGQHVGEDCTDWEAEAYLHCLQTDKIITSSFSSQDTGIKTS